MKRFLHLLMFSGIATGVFAQEVVEDKVALGAGSANQVWYSLENGKVGEAPLNEWHLAFDAITSRSSEVFINDGASVGLAAYPGSVDDWSTLDTAGYYTWPALNNDYESWETGAFYYSRDPEVWNDFGWGLYNLGNHHLYAARIFVVKIGSVYKKLIIDELTADQDFKMRVANLDGSDEKAINFNRSFSANKLWGYINLLTGEVFNREPDASEWDLVFEKYLGLASGIRYGVTGLRQNTGVTVATAYPVEDAETFTDTTGLEFKSTIAEIGYDWKAYNFAENKYVIEDSTVYFVKDKAGSLWKMIMRGYSSPTAEMSFTKEKLNVSTGIVDRANGIKASLAVYPNPAVNGRTTIAYDVQQSFSNLTLEVIDLSGRTVFSKILPAPSGLQTYSLSTDNLSSGLYVVRVGVNGQGAAQKLIVR